MYGPSWARYCRYLPELRDNLSACSLATLRFLHVGAPPSRSLSRCYVSASVWSIHHHHHYPPPHHYHHHHHHHRRRRRHRPENCSPGYPHNNWSQRHLHLKQRQTKNFSRHILSSQMPHTLQSLYSCHTPTHIVATHPHIVATPLHSCHAPTQMHTLTPSNELSG